MLKKALIYLGLGPDEEYEQYEDFAPSDGAAPVGESEPAIRAVPAPTRPKSSSVRPVPAPVQRSTSVRAVPIDPADQAVVLPTPIVRPVERGSGFDGVSNIRIVESAPTTPHAVTPTSFNEAQDIGDRFKIGQPVIINLQGVERDLRRRLVDFASGLCYALGGKMDRVADQVYLLTPADAETSPDDARGALD